eukprot:2924435-Amphidinium_carterae.1
MLEQVWFHVDGGTAGSHVLINEAEGLVKDADLKFAAQIAAYHSKVGKKFTQLLQALRNICRILVFAIRWLQ